MDDDEECLDEPTRLDADARSPADLETMWKSFRYNTLAGPHEVERWIYLLRNHRPEIRAAAATALGLIRDPRAIRHLIHAVHRDYDPSVVVPLIEALGQFRGPEVATVLVHALGSYHPAVQNAAQQCLVGLRAEAVAPLRAALRSRNPRQRAAAVRTLGRIGGPHTVPVLIEMLWDDDPGVIAAAERALSLFAEEVREPLTGLLRTGPPFLRISAARVLERLRLPLSPEVAAWCVVMRERWEEAATIGSLAVEPLLLVCLEGPTPARKGALGAIGLIRDPEAVPSLLAALAYADPEIRRAALRALRTIGDPRALPQAAGLTLDTQPAVREEAVELLGESGWPEAFAPLCAALRDPCLSVRRAGVRALVRLGDPRAARDLCACLAGAEPDLRVEIAEALGRLGNVVAGPDLVAYLADPSPVVREAAARSIGKLRDGATLPALIGALHDPVPAVQEAVVIALGELGDRRAVEPLVTLLLGDGSPPEESAEESADGNQAFDPVDPLGEGWLLASEDAPLEFVQAFEPLLSRSAEHDDSDPDGEDSEEAETADEDCPEGESERWLDFGYDHEEDHEEDNECAPWGSACPARGSSRRSLIRPKEDPEDIAPSSWEEYERMTALELSGDAVPSARASAWRIRWLAASTLARIGGTASSRRLLAALGSPDLPTRLLASMALGCPGNAAAAPFLVAALRDEEWAVRREAAMGLERIGVELDVKAQAWHAVALGDWERAASLGSNALEALRDAVWSREPAVAVEAARALVVCEGWSSTDSLFEAYLSPAVPTAARSVLADGLVGRGMVGEVERFVDALREEEDPWVRADVARALGSEAIYPDLVVGALIAALDDPEDTVRIAAARSLGQIGEASAVKPLLLHWRRRTVDVEWNVIDSALYSLAKHHVAPALVTALGDEELRDIRAFVLYLLATTNDPVAFWPLVGALATDDDPALLASAQSAFFRFVASADVSLLPLDDVLRGGSDPVARRAAARALWASGKAEALEWLAEALREEDEEMHRQIEEGMRAGSWSEDYNPASLQVLLRDPHPRVRGLAVAALVHHFGTERSLELLSPLRDDPDPEVRATAQAAIAAADSAFGDVFDDQIL